mmetsp:Transcript_33821/g.97205  ORF Transcript_33821/g.97205 Transcript_33821/m.97205 type:complete len:261 (-) Transcript_33821:7-789(-)
MLTLFGDGSNNAPGNMRRLGAMLTRSGDPGEPCRKHHGAMEPTRSDACIGPGGSVGSTMGYAGALPRAMLPQRCTRNLAGEAPRTSLAAVGSSCHASWEVSSWLPALPGKRRRNMPQLHEQHPEPHIHRSPRALCGTKSAKFSSVMKIAGASASQSSRTAHLQSHVFGQIPPAFRGAPRPRLVCEMETAWMDDAISWTPRFYYGRRGAAATSADVLLAAKPTTSTVGGRGISCSAMAAATARARVATRRAERILEPRTGP